MEEVTKEELENGLNCLNCLDWVIGYRALTVIGQAYDMAFFGCRKYNFARVRVGEMGALASSVVGTFKNAVGRRRRPPKGEYGRGSQSVSRGPLYPKLALLIDTSLASPPNVLYMLM